MRETLIYIVNQLSHIAVEDLSKAEMNIMKAALKSLGWTYTINPGTGMFDITEK